MLKVKSKKADPEEQEKALCNYLLRFLLQIQDSADFDEITKILLNEQLHHMLIQ